MAFTGFYLSKTGFPQFFTKTSPTVDGPTDGPTDGPMDGPTDGPTDGRTNGLTDKPAEGLMDSFAYRDTRTHLKQFEKRKGLISSLVL